MIPAQVIGRLVPSRIIDSLRGETFLVCAPLDAAGATAGQPFIACDAIGANDGERVFIAQGREATFPLREPFNPADHTIVAIIDAMD
jgi:microcompartment protein CcmK/EutM